MEKVKELKVFNFTKENAGQVKLHLGATYTVKHDQCNNEAVEEPNAAPYCYRWMVTSGKSPLPIRNGTWFQGFNASAMINWFTDRGYALQSVVDSRGNILFHKKETEKDIKQKTDAEIADIEKGFYELSKTNIVRAVRMYKSIYGCDLCHARDMIDDIVRRKEEA